MELTIYGGTNFGEKIQYFFKYSQIVFNGTWLSVMEYLELFGLWHYGVLNTGILVFTLVDYWVSSFSILLLVLLIVKILKDMLLISIME